MSATPDSADAGEGENNMTSQSPPCDGGSSNRSMGLDAEPSAPESVEAFVKRTHRCGTCLLWSCPVGSEVGACEGYSDISTDPPNFEGVSYRDATGALMTTADCYCDMQAPIPPPGPPCRKCGEPTYQGFGLMGGGYGAYEVCEAPGCGHIEKFEEFPEDWS